jgi:hypothetical protein
MKKFAPFGCSPEGIFKRGILGGGFFTMARGLFLKNLKRLRHNLLFITGATVADLQGLCVYGGRKTGFFDTP